jgi:hypothetical protein
MSDDFFGPSLGPDLVRVWYPNYEAHLTLMTNYIAVCKAFLGPTPDWTPFLREMRRCAFLEDRRGFMDTGRQLFFEIYKFLLEGQMQDELESVRRTLNDIGARHE